MIYSGLLNGWRFAIQQFCCTSRVECRPNRRSISIIGDHSMFYLQELTGQLGISMNFWSVDEEPYDYEKENVQTVWPDYPTFEAGTGRNQGEEN